MKKVYVVGLFFLGLTLALTSVSLPVYAQFGGGGGGPSMDVLITHVDAGALDEVVTLENKAPFPIDLTGWHLEAGTLSNTNQNTFHFGEGCVLMPGAVVNVHSGVANLFRGSDACGQAAFDLVWQGWFALADGRGVITLKDSSGDVITSFEYPSMVNSIYINEVEINPGGSEAGNEWVELYNHSDNAIDLTDWEIGAQVGTSIKLTIPLEGVIPANGYMLVQVGVEFLNNQGEVVELRKPDGSLADQTPEAGLLDLIGDDRCWGRVPSGGAGWGFQPCTQEADNLY